MTGIQTAWLSLCVGIVVFALKYYAFWLTGSVALYSDALESTVNIVAALAAVIALHISARPADNTHPYGHSKAEYFSAVLEGVLIVFAAYSIAKEAFIALLNPKALGTLDVGAMVSLLASGINAVLAVFLTAKGKALHSPALTADGKHVMTDVISSVGVLAGVMLAKLTGLAWLDPALALLVAGNIVFSGYGLMKDSLGGLMDAAPNPEILDRVRKLVAEHGEGALEAHDLRGRYSGHRTFIEFHLVVPGSMTVQAAHDICDRIEKALEQEMNDLEVSIHIEPEHHAKHQGIVVL